MTPTGNSHSNSKNLEQDLHALGQALAPAHPLAPTILAQLHPLSADPRRNLFQNRLTRLGMGIAAALMLGATGLAANYVVSHDTLTPRLFALGNEKPTPPAALPLDNSGSAAARPTNSSPWYGGSTYTNHPDLSTSSAIATLAAPTPADSPADRKALERLNADVNELSVDHQPLEKVLQYLSETQHVNIFTNWTALSAAGIDKSTQLSVNLHDVPLRKALTTVLSEVGGATNPLSYTIDDGVVTISTKDELNSERYRVVRVYDIRDMLAQPDQNITPPQFDLQNVTANGNVNGGPAGGEGGLFSANPTPQDTRTDTVRQLLTTIKSTVAPTTWADNGGTIGSIQELNGQLIVNTTLDNQHAVQNLLQQLPHNPAALQQSLASDSATRGESLTPPIPANGAVDSPLVVNDAVAADRRYVNLQLKPGLSTVDGIDSWTESLALRATQADHRYSNTSSQTSTALGLDGGLKSLNATDGAAMIPTRAANGTIDGPTSKQTNADAHYAMISAGQDRYYRPTDDADQPDKTALGWKLGDTSGATTADEKHNPTELNRISQTYSDSLSTDFVLGRKTNQLLGSQDPANPQRAGDVKSPPNIDHIGNIPIVGNPFTHGETGSASTFALNGPGAASPATQPAPGTNPPPAPTPPPNTPAPEIAPLKIIRSGTMNVEVRSFDDASAAISSIATEEGGYVSSTTSDKLANGKLEGTITVRVPPAHLDRFLLKLRALGDIKSQQVAAADITKQYTDVQSELTALHAMETRLLDLIKTGKGEVKDLIEAEKTLGDYRVRIEKLEGDIRYYNNLVAMSTMIISLYEKDLQTPAAIFETENVTATIETDQVDARYRDARKAIEDAKGRIIESELKKQEAGQLAAHIVCDVPPDHADLLTAQLKQLGNVIRLESSRRQSSDSGSPNAAATAKVQQKDTRFLITMYNLANIAPRQTNVMTIAVKDVAEAYRTILEGVRTVHAPQPANAINAGAAWGGPAGGGPPFGTIVNSSIQGQRPDQMSADIRADVRSSEAAAILQALRSSGEILNSTLTENPDTANVTPAKTGFQIHLVPLATVAARETTTLSVAALNVAEAYRNLLAAAHTIDTAAGGGGGGGEGGFAVRILQSQLNESNALNVSAVLEIQFPRSAAPDLEKALSGSNIDILSRSVSRSNDTANTIDSRLDYLVSFAKADNLPPRRTVVLGLEVPDVAKSLLQVRAAEAPANAREQGYSAVEDKTGRSVGHIILDVPSGPASSDLLRTIQSLGDIKLNQLTDNPQLADSKFARDRLDLTFSNRPAIVAPNDSLAATLRSALTTAVLAFFKSLYFIILGILFLGPILLLGRIVYWFWRRRKPTLPPPAPPSL